MLDRHRLEVAISSGSLGMLADDVVVALLRYLDGTPLTARDFEVLKRARDMLSAITQLDERQVATGSALRAMAPLRALDEAVETVNSANASQDLSAAISSYLQTLGAIIDGQGDVESATQLKDLFERIAELTLARSQEIVRPGRLERDEWIKKALNL